MRYLIAIFFWLGFLLLNAQDIVFTDGEYTFQKILETGIDSETTYNRVRQWFVETYNSSEEVIEIEDKEQMLIMGKGISTIPIINRLNMEAEKRMKYTLKAEMKDDRMRLTFNNILYIDDPYSGNGYQTLEYPAHNLIADDKIYKKNNKPRIFNKSVKDGTVLTFSRICEDLEKYLKKDIDDDW